MNTTAQSITTAVLSSPDYIERARALAAIVEANAADGEAAGAMPEATVAALKQAGLFWMLVESEPVAGAFRSTRRSR